MFVVFLRTFGKVLRISFEGKFLPNAQFVDKWEELIVFENFFSSSQRNDDSSSFNYLRRCVVNVSKFAGYYCM